MLRTDTGNFNRFLTSLGLLLLAAAVVIPYFFFRSTEVLTIPDSDLRGMTETGRSALRGRQDAIAFLEPLISAGAVLLAVFGVVLVVLGGIRLKSAQESEDEETELRKSRTKLEMQEMSPIEKEEQATEKAEAEVAQERETATIVGASITVGDAVTVDDDVSLELNQAERSPAADDIRNVRATLKDRQEQITRVSGGIEEAFRNKDLRSHSLKWQVRIGSATDQIRLDGVFESTDDKVRDVQDVVLTTRVSSDPRLLRRNAQNAANDLIALLSRYRALTGRNAQGWLVTVIPTESESDLHPDVYGPAADSLRNAIQPFGKAVLLDERELDTLPRLFIQQFRPA